MSKRTKSQQLQISGTPEGNSSLTATEVETIDHCGLPLPSSAELMGYERACPGAADRIMALAEKQFEHRIEQDRIQQKSDNEFRAMGVVVGIFIVLLFAVIAILFAFTGRQVEALAAIITPMVAFAVAVLKHTSSRSR